jgi:hypothetical protein
VLWIPRPQKIAKASNIDTSQSENGCPLPWKRKLQKKKE